MSSDYYTHPMQYPHMAQFHAPHSQQMAQGNYPTGGYPTGAGYGAYQDPNYAHTAMQASAYPAQQVQQSGSWFNFSNDRFLKGLLIGAAATYLLTNESVQHTAIKGVVKTWSLVQGAVEEIKERFHDAEAEIHAAESSKEE